MQKCWQTAIDSILERSSAIAAMNNDSGYIRTTENPDVAVLKRDMGAPRVI